MPIQFPNNTLSVENGKINVKNSVIQFVDNTTTVNVSATTAAWVDLMSTSITTSKANNKILVEYMCNHRNDFAQANWCLTYHRILVTSAAAGLTNSQVMYSGHIGSASLHIGFYERTFLFNATAQGSYTFTASCLAHQGTVWMGTLNSGSTQHYLRLYEIGT
jgi:hypothetical protein